MMMETIAITAFISVIISGITFFCIGHAVGKREEARRWKRSWTHNTPIKFENRLYEVKRADIKDFIDE